MIETATETELAIVCDELSVNFGDFAALKNIDLEIKTGRVTGLLGPSGAGKTTLMRAIVGRQKLSSGTINVFDRPAGSEENRRQLSYKTQEISAYEDLTVSENFRYFAAMQNIPKNEVDSEVKRVIERIDLTPQANQLVSSLSGGQRQRVSLGITLLGSPELLILDEPTVGLDPVLRDSLWQLFRQMVEEGTTIVISTHVMEEAERCDDLAMIREGRLIAHDSPQQIIEQTNSDSIEQSFLKLARGEAK